MGSPEQKVLGQESGSKVSPAPTAGWSGTCRLRLGFPPCDPGNPAGQRPGAAASPAGLGDKVSEWPGAEVCPREPPGGPVVTLLSVLGRCHCFICTASFNPHNSPYCWGGNPALQCSGLSFWVSSALVLGQRESGNQSRALGSSHSTTYDTM